MCGSFQRGDVQVTKQISTFSSAKFRPALLTEVPRSKKDFISASTMAMEMDVDKSDDELDLERLVFGDSEGIKELIQGKKGKKEKSVQETNLEHLEDDQVRNSFS